MFALWGVAQLVSCPVFIVILWRYNSLIPFMCLLTFSEWATRMYIAWWVQISLTVNQWDISFFLFHFWITHSLHIQVFFKEDVGTTARKSCSHSERDNVPFHASFEPCSVLVLVTLQFQCHNGFTVHWRMLEFGIRNKHCTFAPFFSISIKLSKFFSAPLSLLNPVFRQRRPGPSDFLSQKATLIKLISTKLHNQAKSSQIPLVSLSGYKST